MWRCTKCAESNDDALPACRKCKNAKPARDPDETSLDGIVDLDRPVPVSESSTVQCPTCGEVFKVQTSAGSSSRIYRRLDAALCPACSRAISPESLVKVAPKDANRVKESLLACPYCGKVLGITTT